MSGCSTRASARPWFVLLACALSWLATASASAQTIREVSFTSDPEDVVITVQADHSLPRPSVRTRNGEIRVRYPETALAPGLQLDGVGQAITRAELHEGTEDDSVTLRLALGDDRFLDRQDVRVERRRRVCTIRIARDLLPPLTEPEPEPAAPDEKERSAQPAAAQKPPAVAEKPTPALAAPKRAEKLPVPTQDEGTSSPIPLLLTITVMLAAAYGVLQLLLKRRAQNLGASPIEVVAHKRLGPRHQLLIVRAFGREHLLSVQGGTTTPIATNDELLDHEILKNAPVEQAAAERERSGRPPARPSVDEPAFGGDLFKMAIAQRAMQSRLQSPLPDRPASDAAPDQPDSQAVAGLVRLRKEAQR